MTAKIGNLAECGMMQGGFVSIIRAPCADLWKGTQMNKLALLAAGAASLAVAAPAQAAALLTSVTITGPSGTVWNTAVDTYYAVFLQRPFGNTLNPNDNFSGSATTAGLNSFVIAGEGWRAGDSQNSDMSYNLVLTFADGASITGDYVFDPAAPGGTFTGGTSSTVGGTTYTLNGFGWDRSRADNVSGFRAVSGGDPNDYTGQFSYIATAVPEPTTWAMFILGFGMLGFGMRRRNAQVSATKARLRFA